MNRSKSFQNFMQALFAISLVYTIIVASIYMACFLYKGLLYDLMIKFNTPSFLPFKLSDSDIKLISSELMDYISGKKAFLETEVSIDGVLTEFYSVRSKIHMADVRTLFQNILFSSYITISVCVVTGFSLSKSSDNIMKKIFKSYMVAIITFIVIISFIVILAIFNFDSMFITFHHIAFTNDYWLLDPNEDFIICLLPEEIFMTYAGLIVIVTVVCLVLVALVILALSKIQLRQEAR